MTYRHLVEEDKCEYACANRGGFTVSKLEGPDQIQRPGSVARRGPGKIFNFDALRCNSEGSALHTE